jgi:cyanate permease
MIGLGFGPLISSFFFDLTGSYTVVFTIFEIASIIAAVLLWMAKKTIRVAPNPFRNSL